MAVGIQHGIACCALRALARHDVKELLNLVVNGKNAGLRFSVKTQILVLCSLLGLPFLEAALKNARERWCQGGSKERQNTRAVPTLSLMTVKAQLMPVPSPASCLPLWLLSFRSQRVTKTQNQYKKLVYGFWLTNLRTDLEAFSFTAGEMRYLFSAAEGRVRESGFPRSTSNTLFNKRL